MRDEAALASAYLEARPRLLPVAYLVTGSVSEAEGIVSDCWPRLVTAHGRAPIEDVEAWATAVVARRALDILRSRSRGPVGGAEQVARMMIGLAKQYGAHMQPTPVLVNGAPGLVVMKDGAVDFVISLMLEGGRVSRVDIIRAPDELALTRPETFEDDVTEQTDNEPDRVAHGRARAAGPWSRGARHDPHLRLIGGVT